MPLYGPDRLLSGSFVHPEVRWFGSDSDHPGREQCKAVFAEHASVVAMLPEDLISPDGRAKLRHAAGLR
ncbi:hypothetical protein GCM10020367_72620 [Streptomyces sannanensis]|uniref:Uncharacterized protein n=2 Tax=Streptomyces sannanensis TaxID=285536 RepID=A0ABP6SQ67_9ACTN